MCILNLAMYGVALVRSKIPDGKLEGICKAAGGSMAAIRKAAAEYKDDEGNPSVALKEACMAAVLPVRELLAGRYAQLDLKDTPFQTYDAASEEEMLEMLVWCVVVDSAIPKTAAGLHMSSADLKKGHPDLKAWVQLHTDCSEYPVSMGNTVIWPC